MKYGMSILCICGMLLQISMQFCIIQTRENFLSLKTNIPYYTEHTLSHYWFYDPVMSLPM